MAAAGTPAEPNGGDFPSKSSSKDLMAEPLPVTPPVTQDQTSETPSTPDVAAVPTPIVDITQTPEFKAALQRETERVFSERLAREKAKLIRDQATAPKNGTAAPPAPTGDPAAAGDAKQAQFDQLLAAFQTLMAKEVAREQVSTFDAAMTPYAHLSTGQREIIRMLHDSEKPEDLSAWLPGIVGQMGVTAPVVPAAASPPQDPMKPPSLVPAASASDQGAPAGGPAIGGIIDLPNASRDQVEALRQQGTLLAEVEKWRNTLPGGGTRVFSSRLKK